MSEQKTQSPESNAAKPIKKPKGWIRWSGLIAFVLIAGLVIGGLYFIGSWALKSKIEDMASQAWGAKVEVASIGLDLNPLGFEVQGLAVTDPEQPMQNLFVIGEMNFSVNVYHLVAGRFVMEDVIISGLKLNQARSTSGALPKPQKPEQVIQADSTDQSDKKSAIKLPSVALPKADEVLAREKLETVEKANQIEQRFEQVHQEWQRIEKTLPSAEKLQSYKTELEQLFSGSIKDLNDLKARQQRLQEIEKRWQQDRESVEKAQAFINTHSKGLSEDLASLQKMPDQDLQRLLSTYSLDESGLKNVTYLLFGETVQQKLDLALDWYRKAQPLLAWIEQYRAEQQAKSPPPPPRFEGQWVEFEEFDPQPKFMIKRVSFDGEIEWGQLQAKLWDVNFAHKTSGKPVRFALFAQPTSQQTGLVIEGQSSAVKTEQVITEGQAKWQDYKVQDWWMAKSDELAINLQNADAQISASFLMSDLDRLQSRLLLDYQNVNFDLSQSRSRDVKTYMTPAFSDVKRFNVEATIDGKILAPTFGADSDLDEKLSKGFNRVINQQVAEFKRNLQNQLDAKLKTVSAPIEAELARLGIDQAQLKDREALLRNLEQQADKQLKQAESEIQGRIDAEKKKLELEAKQKLAEEQLKIEEQKKKAEAEAKKRLEDELKKRLPF